MHDQFGLIVAIKSISFTVNTRKMQFPQDIGRVPIKIGSSISMFTADQWHLLTVFLSPIAFIGTHSNQYL